MYSGFNNAPHLHTGDVSITELLRIRYELDLTNERDIQIVLIDYNGKVHFQIRLTHAILNGSKNETISSMANEHLTFPF